MSGLHMRRFAPDGECAFGYNNDAEMFTHSFAHHNAVSNLLGLVGNLRDQDDVRATGDAGLKRDPSGVPAHHLHDQHAPMAFGRRVKLVEGVSRGVHGGVKTKSNDRTVEIVVEGLRTTNPGVGEFAAS